MAAQQSDQAIGYDEWVEGCAEFQAEQHNQQLPRDEQITPDDELGLCECVYDTFIAESEWEGEHLMSEMAQIAASPDSIYHALEMAAVSHCRLMGW